MWLNRRRRNMMPCEGIHWLALQLSSVSPGLLPACVLVVPTVLPWLRLSIR